MSFNNVFFGLLVLHAIRVANGAIGPVADLTVSSIVIQPDGLSRHSVVADGTIPGPLVRGNKGDSFSINVRNNLTDPTLLRGTSINWQGIHQRGSSWADGVVGVTQCPISPGSSFRYDFTPSGQAGTFLYHSHFGTQACDGLKGPMVIYDPDDPFQDRYDVDDESTIITLTEWYHLQTPSIPFVVARPVGDATLINGRGRYPNGPLVDLAVINVQQGKRYRFRLVSLSCDPNHTFSIDGHELTVIEADGQATKPYNVDTIRIFAGQRYSFILKANRDVGNYWIRAQPNTGNNLTGFDNGINSAILRYKGAPIADPSTCPNTNPKVLDEKKLHSLNDPKAPGKPFAGGVDQAINLKIGFNTTTRKWSINNSTYVPPNVPVLTQALQGARDPRQFMPEGSVITVERNKVIEVSIPATVGDSHPFHLDGHSFSVVRSSGADAPLNYLTPVRRDVVDIGGPGSNVTIRFETNNPGPWILRCEIDWHLNNGLAIVFAEAPVNVAKDNNVPATWEGLCPTYDSLPASATSVTIVKPTFL
ncbi:hypothetical protein AX17_006363 [Amanita inopinata Kibby_2008]|nr:hypothetical protein AX17_006363 [Amanita inopinata Kibby_2008]